MQDRAETTVAAVRSTLPRPWEQETTFHDVLYEWMGRAPWLAISAAAHLFLFFLLMSIPWEHLERPEGRPLEVLLERVEDVAFEEPPPEEQETIEEQEPDEEPRLLDEQIVDDRLDEEDSVDAVDEGDPFPFDDAPFDSSGALGEIGLVGGAGNRYGDRWRGLGGGPGPGSGVQGHVRAALEWLEGHQSPDGSWDCDGFMARCGQVGSSTCAGAGAANHDVGVTSLALLAFLGTRNTMDEGPYREVVRRGVLWLIQQQDPDRGLVGDRSGHDYLYDHSIATLALCEAYHLSRSPQLKRPCQAAVHLIQRARNPYGAWRYDDPPIGDNDTSVTGWMLFALAAAEEAGLAVDRGALEGGLSWIDEVTDPATGRVGYDSLGSLSSRTPANGHYPREKGEAMTAVGLLCRIFLGQDPADEPILEKHADLLLRSLPEWDAEGFGCDMYYWYYGTYAMFQMGGTRWRSWNRAMKKAVLESQRKDGDEKGSWDPVGPWGHSGGRVYSTALMTLCLQVYFRYTRVLGAR